MERISRKWEAHSLLVLWGSNWAIVEFTHHLFRPKEQRLPSGCRVYLMCGYCRWSRWLSLEGLLQLSSLPFLLVIQLQSGWAGCCWVRLFIWGVVVLTTVRFAVRKWCPNLAWYSEIVDRRRFGSFSVGPPPFFCFVVHLISWTEALLAGLIYPGNFGWVPLSVLINGN